MLLWMPFLARIVQFSYAILCTHEVKALSVLVPPAYLYAQTPQQCMQLGYTTGVINVQ